MPSLSPRESLQPVLISGTIRWVSRSEIAAATPAAAAIDLTTAAHRAGVRQRPDSSYPAIPVERGVNIFATAAALPAALRAISADVVAIAHTAIATARANPRTFTACAAVVAVWLLGVIVSWQAAQLAALVAGFAVVFLTLQAGARLPGSLSAYSVFNAGFQRLPGQLTAGDFDAEIRGGLRAPRSRSPPHNRGREPPPQPLDEAARREQAARLREAAFRRAGGGGGGDIGGQGGARVAADVNHYNDGGVIAEHDGEDDDGNADVLEEERQLQEALRRSLAER